jgi:hypothetical protein
MTDKTEILLKVSLNTHVAIPQINVIIQWNTLANCHNQFIFLMYKSSIFVVVVMCKDGMEAEVREVWYFTSHTTS